MDNLILPFNVNLENISRKETNRDPANMTVFFYSTRSCNFPFLNNVQLISNIIC